MSRTVKMLSVATLFLAGISQASAEWNTFVIRNASGSGNPPTILDNSTYGLPATEFIVTEAGQKAAWGSSSLDGRKLSEIARLRILRLDDTSRFTAGSGPAVAPYFNIWITNGSGKYAVIANEPSNPEWTLTPGSQWNTDWEFLRTKTLKVYENNDKTWLPYNGVGLTFADLADFIVQAPSVAELTAGWSGLGTGAPRELGTNVAYGFNWIFGDTLSNYVSGGEGFVVAQPVANPFVTTQYLVSPASLAAGKPQFSPPHGTGTNPFGYDWDSAAPVTAADAPSGHGASSFYASVVNDSTGAGADASAYRTLRLGLRTLFGHNVTIGQVSRISYYTKKPAPQTAIDWRVSIYTTWDPAGGNMSSWYRNRIQNHPSAAVNLSAPADAWNIWSTAVGTNQMLFATNRPGFTSENIAFSELAGGPVNRGSYTWDFSNEEIMMVDLTLGANSGGGTGESQLDGVRIELATGEIADIDLTAGTTWKVATVHGASQFTIGDLGSSLLYHQQPRNTRGWYWDNNNGSPPGTLATGGLQTPDGYRDGSRTFACTDVAVGQPLNSVKLAFDYKTALGYVTINYFLTDGNGKFGIFAPTSLGIAGVSTIQVLDGEWSRITLDLTGAIPDSTNVAIYEHNGFSTEHVEPFTTMQWGDIKNLQVAGMYDYQRSPAHGWGHWSTVFDDINQAGASPVTNAYGLALIWGDTVGNNTYATQSRQIRNVQVSVAGTEYAGTFADAQISDVLALNVQPQSIYLKPGESLVVDMDVSNLAQKVNACQALLGYNSNFFEVGSVAPGGGVWDLLIFESWALAGEINTAIGVDAQGSVGTDADGTVAKITMTAKTQQGTTQMVFLPDVNDVKGTYLSNMSAEFVYPTKIDSTTIYIDGTNPAVDSFSAAPLCTKTTTTLTFAVSDDNAGVDYVDVYVGTTMVAHNVASPYVLDLSGYATGCYAVSIKVVDKAGNEADSPAESVCVDKTAPAISNIQATQNGSAVLCPANALQGVVDIYVDVTDDGCADLVVPPTVAVAGMTVTYVDVTGDTYHYQVTVDATTANGLHGITVTALDALANSSSDSSAAICVDKNQATGTVSFVTLRASAIADPPSPADYTFQRVVTFVATNSSGAVLKTWTPTLSFVNNPSTQTASAAYTLTGVPGNTARLSAKTAWSLRKRLDVSLDSDGQASAAFVLLGGDINATNSINVLDYSVLKTNWNSTNTIADVNGDGQVWSLDYSLMKANWFQVGDPQ